MGEKSIKSKTIKGLFWSFFELVSNQGVQFLIQIVLARLLMPEEFGIIGMFTIFMAVSYTFIDSGFTNALIKDEEVTQRDYSTVFNFNMGMAVILYGILFLSAPLISDFFNEPTLIVVIRVISIVLVINAASIIQRTILTRKIDFKSQAKIDITASVVSGAIAIVMAFLGYGIWSLIFRVLIMSSLQTILLTATNRWKPSMVFDIKSFKRLFAFGWKLLLSALIDTIYRNLYFIIIGKYFSAARLGYFTNAKKLSDTASESITASIQKVSFPVLSSIQTDEERLILGLRKILKNTIFITFPMMFGLASVAKPMILLLLGSKWSESIIYFQILCFSGMLYPLQALNLSLLKVKGRSDLFLKLEIITKSISIPMIFIVVILGKGMIALLMVGAAASLFSYTINIYFTASVSSYTLLQQLKDVIPTIIAAIGMAIIVIITNRLVDSHIFINFALGITTGVVAYTSLCWLIGIEELRTTIHMVKSFVTHKNFND